MDYAELHHYTVKVLGLAPIETWYDPGYRLGEELRTSVISNPIAVTNEKFANDGVAQRVMRDETWRVCVTGMRDTPLGVDVTPYVIERSELCSDLFTIP